MNGYKILLIVGVAVIATMGIIFGMDISKLTIATQDYDLYVDPLIDKQSLFITSRVTIQNIGSQPLSNVKVNFGGGDTLNLGTLTAGEKVIVSPPENNKMEFVMVTADPDVLVSKAYREAPKMVGMMGS